MTAAKLQSYTARDLGQMAKKKGVRGWHSMTKAQLVRALVKASQKKTLNGTSKKASTSRNGVASKKSAKKASTSRSRTAPLSKSSKDQPARKQNPRVKRRLAEVRMREHWFKNLSAKTEEANGNGSAEKGDRLVLMVRDAYWLHAHWSLTRQRVERARAALGQNWHECKPILRLMKIDTSSHNGAETVVRDIPIHGGVNNWYIDVQDPPQSYRVEIGYVAGDEQFYSMARSNIVTTPKASSSDSIDENWTDVAESFEKVYALSAGPGDGPASVELQELFEERLRRPMGSPMVTRFGVDTNGTGELSRGFDFMVDAELIVYGATAPNAHVTLQGDPVQLRSDGTFTVRFSMPNCRQVIPVVASSANGVEQRTIVLAVERNTKVMEPLIRNPDE